MALGCRVNRADSDALAAGLGDAFEIAREGERADFVVVNTCAITGDAESAARQALRRAVRDHPGAKVVAAGCHAELRPDELREIPGVAAVVGAKAQASLPGLLSLLLGGASPEEAAREAVRDAPAWTAPPVTPARHTRPFLKVQDGCDQRCAFCVVPLARGPSRSLPLDEALRALALLGERHREVVLTGVHVGAWGRDLAPPRGLAELVREAAGRRLVHRLRISSVEPDEFPAWILREPGTAGGLCDHFHLPLQSGSDRILAAMRRPHRADVFARRVEEIAGLLPGACLGTDVISGFPGETEEDHRATVALVEALPLAYLHVFPFSPRRGTPAAGMEGAVPISVVRERVRELLSVSDRKWRAFLAAQAGRELEVVVERVEGGVARGTSRRWAAVRWPSAGEPRGSLAAVRVEGSDGAELFGVRAGTSSARLPP